ncbi:MAG: serine/threonine protein kinase [Phycisphaerales bacterium]|nr:serine/threonine protein kinase [Phycisphaerales bacterium]
MTSNIKVIFATARALQEPGRSEYLDGVCGRDSELRSEVEGLLTESMNAEPVFDPDATIEQSETKIDSYRAMYTPSTPLPEKIGKYRILSEIGEGGMGTVYEAEQDSPRRKVALKVIKAGVVSKNLLLRFEIEAQILGKLDHPGIATIFEAGTFDEGQGKQPFFAMEFVQGELLTEYADKHKLGTRDRLGLLAKIADAVQHAHQKGVIHRDLKPGNILVTDEGQIKILDFGVARATDADIQTVTMQTDIGQLIGTIPYMSPEQVSGNPDDLDTRSDVYALGIIGYELLTGQMPYDVKQKMIHEAVRVIREDEPKALSSINKSFRGDVEIIVSKALVKEKERRYQSASDLASDIHRYLNNEPIDARPPSTWYHLSKFSRRNKALVAGIAAVLVVSVAGALISINFAMGEAEQKRIAIDNAEQAREAQQAAEEARAEESKRADELEQVADFQSEQLGNIEIEMMGTQLRDSIIEGAPEDTRAALSDSLASVNFTNIALGTLEANIFIRTIEAIDIQFIDQPVVQAQMLQTTADTLRELGLLDLATDPQSRALKIRRTQLGSDHPNTLTSISNMGFLLYLQGKLGEAEPYWREALASSRRVLGDDHPDTLNSIGNMGTLFRSQSKLDEAERYDREALASSRRVLGNDDPSTLTAINNMGFLLYLQGKLDEAEPYYREALASKRRVLGNDHSSTLNSIKNMGTLLRSQGKLDEAERYTREALASSRRVLGDDHPDTLTSINNMGFLLYSQGRLDEAEPYFREAMASSRRTLGDEHPDALDSVINMVVFLDKQNRWSESEEFRRLLVKYARRAEPNGEARLGSELLKLGLNLNAQDQPANAEIVWREYHEIQNRVMPDGHWVIWDAQSLLGETLAKQSQFVEAEGVLVEAAEQIDPPENSQIRRQQAIQRVVDLYTAWHAAEPGNGYDTKAEDWRGRLGESD